MVRYANFDNYGIKFEGGDTFCVKSQITENDSILKYMRYREKQQKRVIIDGLYLLYQDVTEMRIPSEKKLS